MQAQEDMAYLWWACGVVLRMRGVQILGPTSRGERLRLPCDILRSPDRCRWRESRFQGSPKMEKPMKIWYNGEEIVVDEKELEILEEDEGELLIECRNQECDEGKQDWICTSCNGSGEGNYDGSRCSSCGGGGASTIDCEECDGRGSVWVEILD